MLNFVVVFEWRLLTRNSVTFLLWHHWIPSLKQGKNVDFSVVILIVYWFLKEMCYSSACKFIWNPLVSLKHILKWMSNNKFLQILWNSLAKKNNTVNDLFKGKHEPWVHSMLCTTEFTLKKKKKAWKCLNLRKTFFYVTLKKLFTLISLSVPIFQCFIKYWGNQYRLLFFLIY